VRGVDQAVGDQEADVFKARVNLGCGAGKQQDHARHEYQHGQHRSGQTGGYPQALPGLDQALGFVHQQHQAGNQQRQNHIDHAIQQQGGGQWRGPELVGEGGQQYCLEHPDTAGYMAEHAGRQGQQVNQHKCAKGRCFRQQQVQHGGGGCDVQRGNDQLQQGQARAGQAQGSASGFDQQVVGDRLLGQAPAVDAQRQQGKQSQHRESNST